MNIRKNSRFPKKLVFFLLVGLFGCQQNPEILVVYLSNGGEFKSYDAQIELTYCSERYPRHSFPSIGEVEAYRFELRKGCDEVITYKVFLGIKAQKELYEGALYVGGYSGLLKLEFSGPDVEALKASLTPLK